MKLSDIKITIRKELSEIYSPSEIEELFSIFCGRFLDLNKIQWRQNLDKELSEEDSKKFQEAIFELKKGKPFQQILGETEFFGMKFFVDENVLIPRPETEELLELAIGKIKGSRFKVQERLRQALPDNSKLSNYQTCHPELAEGLKCAHSQIKIIDIGTGSGIIPIVLKKHFPDAKISAFDISEKALDVAKKNARFHQAEINFIKKDYLNEPLSDIYDIIISNPPYIGIEENIEIENQVKGFEPNLALFSPTSDALVFYKKIAKDAEKYLSENGMIFLEINQKLGLETLELFREFSYSELIKDISGNDRMIFVRK